MAYHNESEYRSRALNWGEDFDPSFLDVSFDPSCKLLALGNMETGQYEVRSFTHSDGTKLKESNRFMEPKMAKHAVASAPKNFSREVGVDRAAYSSNPASWYGPKRNSSADGTTPTASPPNTTARSSSTSPRRDRASASSASSYPHDRITSPSLAQLHSLHKRTSGHG